MVVQPPTKEIRIYSHSGLFYWWPVWFFGFLFSIWTWAEGTRLAILPSDSMIVKEEDGSRKIVVEQQWEYMTRISRPATDREREVNLPA